MDGSRKPAAARVQGGQSGGLWPFTESSAGLRVVTEIVISQVTAPAGPIPMHRTLPRLTTFSTNRDRAAGAPRAPGGAARSQHMRAARRSRVLVLVRLLAVSCLAGLGCQSSMPGGGPE